MKKWVIIHMEKFYKLDPTLDVVDACIMCYIHDICGGRSRNIVRRKINKKRYTWIDYKYMIREMPMLRINNTVSLYNRIKKLEKAGLLEKEVHALTKRAPYASEPCAGSTPSLYYNRQCFFRITKLGKSLYNKKR